MNAYNELFNNESYIWLCAFSSVPVKSICKVKRTEESHLKTVHLEYNYINVKKIPRAAFSCIRDPSKIILEPQTQS